MIDNELLALILRFMHSTILELSGEGRFLQLQEENIDTLTRAFFGFGPEEVSEVHAYREDVGCGIWFRLKDGRVISSIGDECPSDFALYDRRCLLTRASRTATAH